MSKIMIVDDDSNIRAAIESLLISMEYQVVGQAESGEQAVKMAWELQPDLVFMDIKMPGMDGISAAEKIRTKLDVAIVFITGYGSRELAERAKRVEPYGYVMKPWADEEIRAAVEIALYKKEAERKLKESEEKFRFFTENVEDILWTVDIHFRTDYVSPSISKVLGFTQEERKSQTLEEMLTPESVQRVLAQLAEEIQRDQEGVADPDRAIIVECEYYRKNGSTLWMENCVKPIRDPEGAIVGILGVSRDMTERKQAEEQLRQAHKMEAIGKLAGGIAHEFNNVLGIILGNAELALDDIPEWNPARKSLKEIRSASLRAKGVVRQIVSYAQKTMTDLKPVEITSIVRKSLTLARASIPAMIEIKENLPAESLIMLGDQTEIHEILMSLFSNAAYAMRENGGALEIHVSSVSLDKDSVTPYETINPGNFIKMTVTDSGKGISPEILKNIFDPYFTTKDVGEGSGMGLAVVYGLVKKCNGWIGIKSETGKGTVVEMLFPRIEEETPEKVEPKDEYPKGNERILLVDDEESMVRMTRQILERLGYRVVGMTDSVATLDRFRTDPGAFDLVITDMAMPHMAGDQLASQLMKIRPDIPILLCTGHSDRIDEDKAREMGIRGFAMKPLAMGELAVTVRELLDP